MNYECHEGVLEVPDVNLLSRIKAPKVLKPFV